MYNLITDPNSFKIYNTNSNIGKNILSKYLFDYNKIGGTTFDVVVWAGRLAKARFGLVTTTENGGEKGDGKK